MGVVTISAPYGAGGSEIGPAVAEALGLPFVDRAIPTTVAERLGVPVDEAQALDGRAEHGFWVALSGLALVPDLGGAGSLGYSSAPDESSFREQTEKVLHEIAEGPGGVILGRAAALVLRGVPGCLFVRLDGREPDRIRAAMREHGISEEEASRLRRENDVARDSYVRHYYRCEPADWRHYHLVVNSCAVPWQAVTDTIVAAARGLGIGCPGMGTGASSRS